MQSFTKSLDLDLFILYDADQHLRSMNTRSCSVLPDPTMGQSEFTLVEGDQPAIALLSSQEIFDSKTGELKGYVTLGECLDQPFIQDLAQHAGFTVSLIVDQTRVVSSLEDGASAAGSTTLPKAFASGGKTESQILMQDQKYYATYVPVFGPTSEEIGLVEVAFLVDRLVAAERRALLSLAAITALVIVLGSFLGAVFSNRLTAPLSKLTAATKRMTHSDLRAPIPRFDDPIEIATLSKALEESRVHTQRMLDDLQKSDAWSKTLIESISDGIVTIDENNNVSSFNQGAERISGRKADEVLGRDVDDVFPSPTEEAPFSNQIPIVGSSGQVIVLDAKERPLTLGITHASMHVSNQGQQSALVLRDVTEEQAAQHMRSHVLANISHEFRTPLSAINASVELMLDDLENLSMAEVGELLNSIHMSVIGLQTLIDNLLESLTIEAGRFTIRPRKIHFQNVILDAIRVMEPLLNRRQQHLLITKSNTLPDLHADPTRLTQVLVNLISNASKYGPVGQPIELIIETQDHKNLHVSVVDRGSGIPIAERDQIFRRFVRLDSEDGSQYGVGLGLSVVKAIIEKHNGALGVLEREGGGSIFWFSIPIEPDAGKT